MNVSIWIQIPVALLSFAYGFGLLILLVQLTARALYLLEIHLPEDKFSVLKEFCFPSQKEKLEETQNILAKPYGALFGFNVGAGILVANYSDWVDPALEPYGLMGFFLVQNVLIGMMIAELVLIAAVIGGCLWSCSRHRAWGPR